jgi:hypothetical protein
MGKIQWRSYSNSDCSLFSTDAPYSYRHQVVPRLSNGQISKLEKAISSFIGRDKSNNKLAQVLACASHSSRVSYVMVNNITKGDAEEVLILSYKWRLLIPQGTTRTMDWENAVMVAKPGEIYKMPNIVTYLVNGALKNGQWDIESATIEFFQIIGEPYWNVIPEMVITMINRSMGYRISAVQIKEIAIEFGLGDRVDPLIAEMKGAGILSPRLNLVVEMLKAKAPIYELNPSLMKKKDNCISIKANRSDHMNASFMSRVTIEQELDFLRNQADAVSEQLVQIEVRIRNLESEKVKDNQKGGKLCQDLIALALVEWAR